MLKVKQLKKFKKDYAQYMRDIEKIPNKHVQENCYEILNKLIDEYNFIDASHDGTINDIDPKKVRSNVVRSIDLRNKLNKLIKDSKDL